MKCQEDIIKLAWSKFKAAESLLANGFVDESYYIGGYTIELLLKANVCKCLKIDDLFDEKSKWFQKLKYPQTFKIHSLESLLILSGLYVEWDNKLGTPSFKSTWSKVGDWSEESRYLTGKNLKDVQDFLTSVKEISQWIEGHL